MKKLIIAILMLIPSIVISAQGVSEEQARQTAADFIASKVHNSGMAKAPAKVSAFQLAWAPTFKNDTPEVYVFNLPNDSGFVIVSGDEGTSRQVLAWSDSGSFDPANMPPVLRYLSAQYVVDIASLRSEDTSTGSLRSKIRRAPASGYGEVAPLLTSQWNQETGYNNLLPQYPTGCVATAMAQIMNYHQWPKHGYGKHTNSYMAEKGLDQTVDFSQSVYDWDAMSNNDSGAISKLMYDFGCAVNMQYNYGGSEANDFDALKALVTNFGYDESSIRRAGRSEETLRNELREGRPVYYAGQDTISKIVWIGSQWYKDFVSDGHAFVCDGFSDDGLFHFNMGWGGRGDGYYTLDVIRPNGDDDLVHSYGPIGNLIYGIKPGEKTCVDGVWYDLDDEAGTATVGSGGYEGDVSIPEQFICNGKSYTVNAMYPYAFTERGYDKNVITNLTFNAAIEEFPARMIRCGESTPGHVENVTFGGGVRRIADEAFRDMEDLLTATFGDNVEYIGKDAFNGCKTLGTINLGPSITEISDGAFRGCNIMNLDVPATVKRIGKYGVTGLFYNVKFNGPIELDTCAVLSKDQIYRLEGLEHCTRIAYQGLTGISGTFTPNPAAKYDSYAISGKFDKIIIPAVCADYDYTTALETKEFYVEPGNPNLASSGGALYTKDMKKLLAQPLLNPEYKYFTDRVIPAGVTEMTGQPLQHAYDYLYLPAGLQHINASSIGLYSIRHVYCMSTTPPTFDDDKQGDIQINARLHVPTGCEEAYAAAPVWNKFSRIVGDMHADGCYLYLHEDGADNASIIGRNAQAFTGHDFVVPSTTIIDGERLPVTWIEPSVFQGDPNVESVTLGAFIESVNSNVFKNCSNLKRVKIEGDIYALSSSAFENCTSLEKVEIPRNNHLINLGERVFAGCTSLESVDLTSQEDEFMNFGPSVFEGCTSLREVKGISNFYRLPARTFANSGIETFHIGEGMHSFDYDDPFEGCTRLHSFTVAADHPSFYVADGILYKRNEYSSYPWSMYVCPPMVKNADGQVVERTIINVSERCDQLNSQFPASAEEIVIPAAIKRISSGTFSYTTNLQKLTVLRDDPNFVDSNVFWAVYTKATLQVPKGKKEAYAAHAEWGKFTNIVEIAPDDYPSPEAIKAQLEAELNAPDDPNIGNALSILMKNGSTHFIRLAQLPVITIKGVELNISGSNINLTLPIDDIRYYVFETYDMSIVEPIEDDSHIDLDFTDGNLNCKGLKSGDRITLYDLQGRLVRQTIVATDGSASLQLSDMPTAVYLLKVNETTYKILKK